MFDGQFSILPTLPVLILNKPEPKKVSLLEYMRREERREARGLSAQEFYNGIIKPLPMARGGHNLIISNLSHAFIQFFEQKGVDAYVFSGQQRVYVPEINTAMIPDSIVICEKPMYWDDNEQLILNPLLIVEVASPSTKKYDETDKFGNYRLIPSFRQYLLIDPSRPKLSGWFREAENLWRDTNVEGLEKTIQLASIGLDLPLERIYRRIEF